MRKILLLSVLCLATIGVFAQGVTTAIINGRVTDSKGEALPGANVIAVHTPSGTQYGTSTRPDGYYTIPNARVGGPYKITVTFVGYQELVREGIILSLGNTSQVDMELAEEGTQLEAVEVQATRNEVLNPERTGAATNIDNQTIMSVPTISRGLTDFTKLSPLASTAGNGTSFAGTSNRYNQFAIDGLVNNDVFGLSGSGTNGGQAGIEPISLDAIQEFQVNIAPYDVRQGGFTGGGINAVTRSGSNTFQGSVYYYGNNESFVGSHNPNTDENDDYPEYKDFQAGARLGGPIIKNKLFFFASGEITRKKTPLAYVPGTESSLITQSDVDRVIGVLDEIAPGYDPGAYKDIENETNSDKVLAKIDWNISDAHKLSIRHSYTYGEDISLSRSRTALKFYNAGVYFPSTTNSTAVELNSIFGTNASNRLLLGYTSVRDDRDPLGDPFPYTIINLDGTSGRTITIGGEYSSVANQLDQDIMSFTDDYTMYRGKHTITFGTNNEIYKFYNLFVQAIYGYYAFASLEDFESQATATPVAPTYYRVGYSFDPNDDPSQSNGAAEFKAMQLGFYVQDDYQVNEQFKVTLGLRADLPLFPDEPVANPDFNAAYGAIGKTGVVPETHVLWSPRLGFNFDVLGDRSLQIRGGTGIFTGRVPFVWVSNQFSNNGLLNGSYSVGNRSANSNPLTDPAVTFSADPFNQPTAEDLGETASRGDINMIDEDFRFPQVFRTNLAVDKQLPWGLVGTIEGIYSKTYNNINFQNINRQVDESFTFDGPDQRPRYLGGRLDGTYSEIVKLENTNKGYSYNILAQLQKQFDKGFTGSLAYSYGDSKDLNSGTSSVAYSNWRYVNNVNGLNDLSLARSNYSAGSRVVGFVSYRKEYLGGNAATMVSLFYNGQSGQAYSYVYNGDMNNDGTSNDMIFVPASADQINLVDNYNSSGELVATAEAQWDALDAFIKDDDYLSERRGKYAERNGARMPFQSQFDLRILQEFSLNTGANKNRIQVSLDIINVGNLLSDEWGKQYTMSNQQFSLINYKGLDGTAPTYTFSPSLSNDGDPWSASDFYSRWRMQIGLRYLFN